MSKLLLFLYIRDSIHQSDELSIVLMSKIDLFLHCFIGCFVHHLHLTEYAVNQFILSIENRDLPVVCFAKKADVFASLLYNKKMNWQSAWRPKFAY